MSQANTLKIPHATLTFEDDYLPTISDLKDASNAALEAYDLTSECMADGSDGRVRLVAGPVGVEFIRIDSCPRITLMVTRVRDSERLHPDAETAILAEIISVMVERFGGGTLDWGLAGVTLDLEKFAASFTPLRRRGGASRICPRRVKRDDTIGTPIQVKSKAPKVAVTSDDPETQARLKQIFADPVEETSTSNLTNVSAWAATATVGAMNPLIGVPLIAYNLTKGADIRVSTQAFALTATLTGLVGSTYGYLPFF
ncbi:hypothetical protein [Pseudooceanicola onchidii]|uniref:hypothetical protein n=1 Tax=Pseudooceanicola onchidii TaxID=2562279 RepID=UPI0010AB41C2|nr:hypothetical protein [Pseudooceanicola onchidii]